MHQQCFAFHSCLQSFVQSMSREDIIARYNYYRLVTDRACYNDKRLRKAVRKRLHSICKAHSKLVFLTDEILKMRCILRRGNDQNIPNAYIHQHRYRVVDHRLAIY